MTIPSVNLETILAVIALATAALNHFRVSSTSQQIKAELKTELVTFKTELKADATLASASVLADALIAGAQLKAEAKAAKDKL